MLISDNNSRLAPSKWPIFWRRAFILTLPVSGLLWLLAQCTRFMLLAFAMFGAVIVLGAIDLKQHVWDQR